jgi:hypothetical protein
VRRSIAGRRSADFILLGQVALVRRFAITVAQESRHRTVIPLAVMVPSV